jgi:hypothetical protein
MTIEPTDMPLAMFLAASMSSVMPRSAMGAIYAPANP